MHISNAIEDLHPVVQARAIAHRALCAEHGIPLLFSRTTCDEEALQMMYEQGRGGDNVGPIITNDLPHDSPHLVGCGYVVAPTVNGVVVCSIVGVYRPVWLRVVECGEACGLVPDRRPLGKFHRFDAFSYTGGLTIAEIRAGANPPEWKSP